MATDRTKPVLRRTIVFLHQHIRKLGLRPGDRLPALPRLACEAEVSYVTMVRAMRRLKESGLVSLINRHSYVLNHAPTDTVEGTMQPADRGIRVPSGQSARAPWERACDRIRQDIANRVFRPGASLPSQKELRSRYRLSFPTVRKALGRLVGEGTIERTLGGGFVVPPFLTAGWRPKIVCINMSPDSYTMSFGQHDEAVFRALELICEQAGISIEVILLRNDQERNRFFLRNKATGAVLGIDDISASDDVLGFFYMVQQVPTEFDAPALRTLLLRRKPIAVLDETSLLELPPALAGSRLVRVFTAAVSSEPGEVVGRHLLSLGHRRVAFISMDHNAAWSRLRLDGLGSAFEAAGFRDGVVPFVKSAGEPGWIVERAMERCGFGVLRDHYDTWRNALPDEYRNEFDPAMEGLRWDTCGRSEVRLQLRPVLEEALADSGITAWVPANDELASMAVDFLKDKGVRIPADLSILSFDDAPEALRRGYSTFNFNPAAVAEAVVGFMLDRKPYNDPGYSVSGFVVNRGTTGLAGATVPLRRNPSR